MTKRLIFAALAVAALSGCGQKGPLYQHEEIQANQSEPATDPQPEQ